jgi:Leucine-rich repeat (LRR) protein
MTHRSSNRFAPLQAATVFAGFKQLTTLNFNRTLLDWNEASRSTTHLKYCRLTFPSQILLLGPSLPELRELQLGDNELASLSAEGTTTAPVLPKLITLNLDSNKLTSWDELVSALVPLPSYAPLTCCCSLADLPPPADSTVSSSLAT